MENFKVKSKTEINLRKGEAKKVVQVMVVNNGVPMISTIAAYSEKDGKVKVLKK